MDIRIKIYTSNNEILKLCQRHLFTKGLVLNRELHRSYEYNTFSVSSRLIEDQNPRNMAKRTLILRFHRLHIDSYRCFFAPKWRNESKGLLNLSISLFLFLFLSLPSSFSSFALLVRVFHGSTLPAGYVRILSRKFLGRLPNRTCNLAVKSFDLHGSSPPSFSLRVPRCI